jgi:pyruvate kinase
MKSAASWSDWTESERLDWLANQLAIILARMHRVAEQLAVRLDAVTDEWKPSGVNLAHYVALRQEDVRELQARLGEFGLSSLGRSEPHVMANLVAVTELVARLRGKAAPERVQAPQPSALAPTIHEGRALLAAHTDETFGPPHPERRVRIMVTMPSEAADRPELVRALVAEGMDVMRINCAHDGEAEWRRMVGHLRAANVALSKQCRVQFDLPGPKLRTGDFMPGPRVLHWAPARDAMGNVVESARVRLQVPGTIQADEPTVFLSPDFLKHLTVGRTVTFEDHRGKHRTLEVTEHDPSGCTALATQGAWVTKDTEFTVTTPAGRHFRAQPVELAALPGELRVQVGQRVRLIGPEELGTPATETELASIPCSLREALNALKPGHRVWFDDGKIGGVVEEAHQAFAVVRLTDGPPTGARLAADKGINVPDTHLDIPALSADDLAALGVACDVGDLVALSYCRSATDVLALHVELDARQASLGVVLKVENREGFENLSSLLLTAMRRPPFGVMIARGDLAVECGFTRLAELQEEMLCLCEAGHAPVVWATQVLETAARKGFPSRAEVTDAAMGERAECVMLNKGPFITQAVKTLDDILRRMESHQRKKTPLFRRLRSLGIE